MSKLEQGQRGISLAVRYKIISEYVKLPYVFVNNFFSEANKKRTWRRAASDSLLRFLCTRPSWDIHIVAYMLGSTAPVYPRFAQKNKLDVLTDKLDDGTILHWVGPRRYDRVVLYFHGGGYCLPLLAESHLAFLHSLQRELEKSTDGVGFVALDYSLTPNFQYPTQLREANAALVHLLEKGVDPANLLISGDSAGGALTFALMLHVMHPLASIPAPPVLSSPFLGAAVISPWVSFDSTLPSNFENDKKDCVPAKVYETMAFIASAGVSDAERPYLEPSCASDVWWDGLENIVGRVYASVGEVEVPRDGSVNFIDGPVRKRIQDTTLMMEANGTHFDMLNAFAAGEGGESAHYWKLIQWLSETFRQDSD
ncbi:alpha/beta-hydrolase [Artomyces pyxidatus]|uniref:Alpha/beta-hydrolase n=1 Tax=Artomyces pyxidatus TaxID=48021 RepID=A0ACB8SJS0_9AGAM|nr:alpha/beta-hydrolase [Artomyces pyxidatus]